MKKFVARQVVFGIQTLVLPKILELLLDSPEKLTVSHLNVYQFGVF